MPCGRDADSNTCTGGIIYQLVPSATFCGSYTKATHWCFLLRNDAAVIESKRLEIENYRVVANINRETSSSVAGIPVTINTFESLWHESTDISVISNNDCCF